MTRPAPRIAAAVILLSLALVACGGGGNDGPYPWQLTIEAKCAVEGACPTFPIWDGTPRPTAVTTPPPGVPTATPAPDTETTP